MKRITKLFTACAFLALSISASAQCTYYEFDKATGTYPLTDATALPKWTNSQWYNIIDIDFEKITDTALPQFTGADGTARTSQLTDYGTGIFTTPVYTVDDQLNKIPTSLNWPVKYYMAVFAPNTYGSAYTKVNINGTATSDKHSNACYYNDNTTEPRDIFAKKGFIELSRQSGSAFSKHGYIEIDSIPGCERIQWSFSTLSWKRGFKADINYHDGKGWQPLRWMPSDVGSGSLMGFGERGYMYEEMINLEADPSALVSFRVRIWDGDSIHVTPLNTSGATFTTKNDPLGQKQDVRIHQIKVFTSTVPEVAPVGSTPGPLYTAPTGLINPEYNGISSRLQNKNIIISETVNASLISVEGKEVFKGTTDRIDVSNYSKGVYILLTTNSNGITNSRKFIL